jgi:murein L,D-transpeptidase YcbB/YkuD
MAWIMRVFAALALLFSAVSAVHATPETAIAAMKGRQAAEWRRTIIDLNLVSSYYDDPANGPIWVVNGRLTPAAAELLESLTRADEDGLDPDDYLTRAILETDHVSGDDDAAGFELAMSQAFLAFARDVHSGQTSPNVSASNIVIPRKPVDAVAWLSLARDVGVEAALDTLRPNHPQYFQLRQMLKGYRSLAARGGWPKVDAGASLKPGMTDLRIGQMRANLKARGYSGIDSADPNLYDDSVIAVVEHFQRRHGLDADGVAGPKTVAAMNMTADERVRQIIVNMERWRWLPDALGSRHVFVNQAGFEMFLVDKGEVVSRHKVIVGKPFHQTPMFSDKIAYAEFNPTWTVTPAIAVAEFLPKLRADPGYLARNDYLLYGGWGAGAPIIDPWSVDWHAVSSKKFAYRIVQQPGAKNALGVVKFMFPNKFNIYLHDTPSRQLFAQTGRAFSHGCIRVHEPVKFAEKLFGLDNSLTPAEIRKRIDSKNTKTASLKTKVPVHLTYFTVWIDDDGLPNFFEDIYDRDALVSRLMFNEV